MIPCYTHRPVPCLVNNREAPSSADENRGKDPVPVLTQRKNLHESSPSHPSPQYRKTPAEEEVQRV